MTILLTGLRVRVSVRAPIGNRSEYTIITTHISIIITTYTVLCKIVEEYKYLGDHKTLDVAYLFY